MDTAKLFWTGRSQAVRLPRAFRFDGDEVGIRRVGSSIILEPIETGWGWLDKVEPFGDDLMADGRQQPPMPDPAPLFD